MPQPGGPGEGRETSAQQAEKAAQEILKGLDKMFTTNTGEELETLKARIGSLITDKLQGLDDHTKRTARSKLEELLTRREHADKLPDVLRRMRGVILDVNKEGKKVEAPASGGGYGFGVPESIKPENLGFWGHAAWAGGIVAVLAYLFGKTKEGANKAWEWTKKVIGLGLIGIGAFLGVKTWAEFQKHKDDLLKARQAAADALASARDATRRLAEGIDGPRQAVEVFRLSRIYERIENELREKGVRGGGAKAQADLNAQVYSVLKGKENLQKAFFAEVHRTFPVSFRSREDIRLEFIIDFKSDTGFEVKERLADVDERLALAEAAQGLFGIYANKRDTNNELPELRDPSSGMKVNRLVTDRLTYIIMNVPAVRNLTIAQLKPLTRHATLAGVLGDADANKLFGILPDSAHEESRVALWFLAKASEKLSQKFIKNMTINGEYMETDEKINALTVGHVLDGAGQYLRLVSRMHAAGVDDITERTVAPFFEGVFSPRTIDLEALSPRVRAALNRLPIRGFEDLFMKFCAQHGKEFLSDVNKKIRDDRLMAPEQKDAFTRAVAELQKTLADHKTILGFFLSKRRSPLSGDPNLEALLERALNNARLGDALHILLYLEEAKGKNGRLPRIYSDGAQEHGRHLLHYKIIELMSRVNPSIAREMYKNFTDPNFPALPVP